MTATTPANQGVTTSLKPLFLKGKLFLVLTLNFVVLPKICINMSCSKISIEKNSLFWNLSLADPQWNNSRPINTLLGASKATLSIPWMPTVQWPLRLIVFFRLLTDLLTLFFKRVVKWKLFHKFFVDSRRICR